MKCCPTKKIKIAALISETEMEELHNFLSENFDNIVYTGETKDGTSIYFLSFDEFLCYPNYNNRNLVQVRIRCLGQDKGLVIEFSDKRFIYPEAINYSLNYNDPEWGFYFEDELNKRLRSFKPWYSFLTYTNLTYVLPVLFIMISLAIFAIDFYTKEIGYTGFISIDYYSLPVSNPIIGYILWIPIVGCCFIINKLRDYLFPLIFIAIGKQRKEYKKRQNWSYFIFGTVGLGIITNIISTLIIK
ncbi:MAG: hypothetical protein LBM61_04390 [Prevotellaceae bacterium]|jgi:hypothetical protein|nr:hypothetical protein [Prevotellaceae bacterium]